MRTHLSRHTHPLFHLTGGEVTGLHSWMWNNKTRTQKSQKFTSKARKTSKISQKSNFTVVNESKAGWQGSHDPKLILTGFLGQDPPSTRRKKPKIFNFRAWETSLPDETTLGEMDIEKKVKHVSKVRSRSTTLILLKGRTKLSLRRLQIEKLGPKSKNSSRYHDVLKFLVIFWHFYRKENWKLCWVLTDLSWQSGQKIYMQCKKDFFSRFNQ